MDHVHFGKVSLEEWSQVSIFCSCIGMVRVKCQLTLIVVDASVMSRPWKLSAYRGKALDVFAAGLVKACSGKGCAFRKVTIR